MFEKSYLADKLSSNKKTEYIIPYKKFQNIYVPDWLLCREDISNGAKLLYGKLCQHSGKDGNCFPKLRTLAEELGCSQRTIGRYVKELKEYGLIEPIRVGKKCSNRYRFLKHEWMEFLVDPEESMQLEDIDETETA